MTSSQITGNSASDGGGIYNSYGTATIDKSQVSGNYGSSGGGVYGDGGILEVTGSTISGNMASYGGAVYSQSIGNCLRQHHLWKLCYRRRRILERQ